MTGRDELLPVEIWRLALTRFLPVLSLTYIASIFGFAAKREGAGRMVHHVLHDGHVYDMALFVALWVSVPAVMWMILKWSHQFSPYADLWYRVMAGLMALTGIMCYVLFPEGTFWGLRIFFVATIPVFIIQYILFVRGGFLETAALPFNTLGAAFMLYGLFI